MNKKLLGLLIVLLFSASCLSIVFADNNTTETVEAVDNTNYIMPISISDDKIEFSDGFTGFCLDLAKDSLIAEDGFTAGATSSDKTENYVKLAIIECYKQGKENDIGKVVAKIVNNDLASDDPIITEVLNSEDVIGDHEVVMIDNTTEATFDFELLKSASDEKSDCLAYKVSSKTVAESSDVLGAPADTTDDVQSEDASDDSKDVQTAKDNTDKQTQDKKAEDTTQKTEDNKQTQDKKAEDDKKTKEDDKNNQTKNNDTNNNTVTQETNKTIINKTTTVIVNENNTTIINQNNVKTINNTTKETPQDNNTENLLKKAGNPILILIIVIAIIIVAVVVMRRKD